MHAVPQNNATLSLKTESEVYIAPTMKIDINTYFLSLKISLNWNYFIIPKIKNKIKS